MSSSNSKGYTVEGNEGGLLPGTGKARSDWVIAWFTWFFGIDAKDNPSYVQSNYGDRSIDYNQGRYPPQFADEKGKVYFLAGAAGTKFTTRSIIPYDTWQCILVPVYIMSACPEEFPSLDAHGLRELVDKDVAGVNLDDQKSIHVTLDEVDIPKSKIEQIKIYDPFDVPLPDENILNLDMSSTKMITNGYWVFLDPDRIEPGEHTLYVLGKSKNYITDTTYNLTVRGKKK
ncbi:MAG: hypothetical protein WCF23_05195 [Candidatus Nitrosopolaris sp.]